MLKADLHMHSNDDTREKLLSYNTHQLIDKASTQGFQVLSLTFHDQFHYTKEIVAYAKSKNILLIPGMERTMQTGEHILLYNFTKKELDKIHSLEDLRKIKKDHHAVFAAHPFFPSISCIRNKIYDYLDIIDGVEYSYMYSRLINFNKSVPVFANKHSKPIIANSDIHFINRLGTNYSLLNCEKTIEDVIKFIKKGPIIIETKPLTNLQLTNDIGRHIWKKIKELF